MHIELQKKLVSLVMTSMVISSCSLGLLLNHETAEPPTKAKTVKPANLKYRGPDFTRYPAGKERKNAFFTYFAPMIARENEQVSSLRQVITSMQQRLDTEGSLTSQQKKRLKKIAEDYRVSSEDPASIIKQLLVKIDVIPESLALAQAGIESAWGTSRFAQQGNNYFGQWCFESGCGLVPKHRIADAAHEVRVFSSPGEAISSYIKNLNSHPAYRKLRTIRHTNRTNNRYLSGCQLAEGLSSYSQKGNAYVRTLKSIIRVNKLEPQEHLSSCINPITKKPVVANASSQPTIKSVSQKSEKTTTDTTAPSAEANAIDVASAKSESD